MAGAILVSGCAPAVFRATAPVEGGWRSPLLPVTAHQRYRVTMKAEATTPWAVDVQYRDATGQPVIGNDYCAQDATTGSERRELIFTARQGVTATMLKLEGQRANLTVSELRIARATARQAARLADATYAGMPPVQSEPPADAGALIPRTMTTLCTGGVLNVVLLGDSIVNDLSNSHWDALLERDRRGLRLCSTVVVRNGGSCEQFLQGGFLERYVVAEKPDLVMIGGISTKRVESVRVVIRRLRAAGVAEMIILSPAGGEYGRGISLKYFEQLRAMAADERVEFVDLTTPWIRYLAESGHEWRWLYRDPTHPNERGRQVLTRILVNHLACPHD